MNRPSILKQYIEDGIEVIEYTKNGTTESHVVKSLIAAGIPIEEQPTVEEQILAETQYQTALIEMNMMGGI